MKKFLIKTIVIFLALFYCVTTVRASTTSGTINTTNKYAWSENIGWVNFSPDQGNVRVTDQTVTGYIWSSNAGWINLAPTSAGVRNNSEGTLSGYAWGSYVGWINFSGVKINSSGKFTGTASGIVTGKINFNCTYCNVTTDWRPLSIRTPVQTQLPQLPAPQTQPPTPPTQPKLPTVTTDKLPKAPDLPKIPLTTKIELDKTTITTGITKTTSTTLIPPEKIFKITKIKNGTKGAEIKLLQKFLNANGFTVAAKGLNGSAGKEVTWVGPGTLNSLLKFQIKYYKEIFKTTTVKKLSTVSAKTIEYINSFYGKKTTTPTSPTTPTTTPNVPEAPKLPNNLKLPTTPNTPNTTNLPSLPELLKNLPKN
jgi:hypothetical protein